MTLVWAAKIEELCLICKKKLDDLENTHAVISGIDWNFGKWEWKKEVSKILSLNPLSRVRTIAKSGHVMYVKFFVTLEKNRKTNLEPWKNMKNQPGTMKNHENQPGTMKTYQEP